MTRQALDDGIITCVLCGGPNDCAMARREMLRAARAESPLPEEEPCWCVGQVFPESLIRRANDADGGASCICLGCLEQARETEACDGDGNDP